MKSTVSRHSEIGNSGLEAKALTKARERRIPDRGFEVALGASTWVGGYFVVPSGPQNGPRGCPRGSDFGIQYKNRACAVGRRREKSSTGISGRVNLDDAAAR